MSERIETIISLLSQNKSGSISLYLFLSHRDVVNIFIRYLTEIASYNNRDIDKINENIKTRNKKVVFLDYILN